MKKNIDKAKEILSSIKDYFIYAAIGGSAAYNVISTPSDLDIIVVTNDEHNRKKCIALLKETYDLKKIRKDYGFDFHFKLKEWQENIITSIYPFFALPLEIIESNVDYSEIKKYTVDDILKNKNKIVFEYKQKLKDTNQLKEETTKYNHKFWYHVYITSCIFENKSIVFSDEQFRIANMLHDLKQENLNERIEIVNLLIEKINNDFE